MKNEGRMMNRGPQPDQDSLASLLGSWLRRDIPLLIILIAAAGGLRAWHLQHTETPARDSVAFMQYARKLAQYPWQQVVAQEQFHPLYPASILVVQQAVAPFFAGPDHLRMQLSAQLANAITGTLLIIPMFYLGRELFSRTVAFWACLWFQFLPSSGRVLSDGLSEGLFLLLAAMSLWLGVCGLRRQSGACFGLCGLFGGLAYLTRPEGALVVATFALVLLVMQCGTLWKRSWRRYAVNTVCLCIAALMVGMPFIAVTGTITRKPSGQELLQTVDQGHATENMEAGHDSRFAAQDSHPSSILLALWMPQQVQESGAGRRALWAFRALGHELGKGYGCVAWFPMIVGFCWYRSKLWTVPGTWAMVGLCFILTLVLWQHAMRNGYVSDRHTLLLILCGIYWAVAGLHAFGGHVTALTAKWWISRQERVSRFMLRKPVLGVILLLCLACPGLSKTLEPLHQNLIAFREAGLWLQDHATPQDIIEDQNWLAKFYSGRGLLSPSAEAPTANCKRVRYIVHSCANERTRTPSHVLSAEAEQGTIVFRTQAGRGKNSCEVVIYALPAGR